MIAHHDQYLQPGPPAQIPFVSGNIFLNENETPTTYIGCQLLNNHEKYNYLF
jgi:hypothetical protein